MVAMEAEPLTAADLAGRAGVAEAEIGRLVGLGILVARDGPAPFLTIDLRKVRLMSPDEQMREDELAAPFMPLVDRALMGICRRQQELVWTEHQVENIEVALEETGALARPERMPAMCFLDLAGYTRLTEERGDQAAAELAEALAVLVERSSRAHGGTPVKWLGDGVMLHFREPAGAVEGALAMVGQVLVTAPVAAAAAGDGVRFTELRDLELKGFSAPVRVLEASWA
jgi:class 3 adenylate cyclase